MIWNAGGNYNWMLQDATGAAGTGYATISGSAGLDLTRLNSNSPFSINLYTLGNVGGTNGQATTAANFNTSSNYTWTLATFAGGITGFNANSFVINTNSFSNSIDASAVWGVITNGNSLQLTYTMPVTTPTMLTNGGGLLTITNSQNYPDGIDLNAGTTIITSTGSVTATNTDYSYVGDTGSNVTLIVSNGTLNVNGLVAGYNPGANSNSIVVNGSSAVATVGANGIILGYDINTGNSLIVTNGGTVTSAGQVAIGSATYSGGGQNQLTISGKGSSLTAQGLLTVADSSDSNSVIVQNGGTLTSAGGTVISTAFSSPYGGTNNSVLVTGSGSKWNNTGGLIIGDAGSGAVTIASGAALVSDTITLAAQTGSTGVLNVGTLGGSDTGVTVSAPTIYFGNGSGALNLNQADTMTLGSVLLGNGALNQNGSGTSVLTGNSSALTGPVTISGGTLQVGASNAAFFANGLGIGAIVNNGTLALRQYNSILIGNAISGNGTLLQDSYSATTTLTGANTSTGAVVVNSGNLQIGNGGTTGSLGSGGVTLANYNSLLTFNRSDDITVANSISGLGAISQVGFGKLTLSGANSFQKLSTVDNGSVAITGSLTGGNGRFYVGNTTSGAALSVENGASVNLGTVDIGETAAANNNTLTVNGGRLSLAASLSVGAATNGNSGNALVINNGGTVSSGNLYVGVAGGTTAGNNSISVSGAGSSLTANGGTVGNFIGANSSSNSLTVSGGASFNAIGNTYVGGSGGVANVATVTGAGSTWSNSETIVAGNYGKGTVNIGNGASVTAGGIVIANNAGSTGTVNVGTAGGSDSNVSVNITGGAAIRLGNGNAALNFNQADTTTVSAAISGNGGTVTQAGTGKTILTGNSSYSGTTAITKGTLQVGNGLGTATLGKTSIQNAGALAFNNAGTSVFAGTIAGAGSFSQNGGTTVLTGVNTYTGDTAINAGTLQVGAGGQLGGGSYAGNIANNGALAYGSDLSQTLSGMISGSGLVTKSSASTLTLSGANTYSGSTTVNAGTLSLGTTGSLASKALAVTGGSTLLLGNNNQLASDAALNLAGQLNLGGGTTHSSQTFASLTLTGNSSIDFGALSGTSSLTFGSLVMNNYALNVFNWTGKPLWGPDSSGAGGANAFTSLFVNSTISSTDLSKINFYSGSSIDTNFLGAGSQQAGGLIVPVPEPGVVLSALMLVGWLIFSQRSLLARLIARRASNA
jgi:fibronectin-binding autotransporter adhesin